MDGTSRAGIEAILVSAIRREIRCWCRSLAALVICCAKLPPLPRGGAYHRGAVGEVFTPDQVEDAIKRIRPRLLLTVQGDTSPPCCSPSPSLAPICRRYDVLFYTDATASLGGNALETDAWGLDAVSAGMQKCLGGPSGTSRSP